LLTVNECNFERESSPCVIVFFRVEFLFRRGQGIGFVNSELSIHLTRMGQLRAFDFIHLTRTGTSVCQAIETSDTVSKQAQRIAINLAMMD
jgi:hypothetical protein